MKATRKNEVVFEKFPETIEEFIRRGGLDIDGVESNLIKLLGNETGRCSIKFACYPNEMPGESHNTSISAEKTFVGYAKNNDNTFGEDVQPSIIARAMEFFKDYMHIMYDQFLKTHYYKKISISIRINSENGLIDMHLYSCEKNAEMSWAWYEYNNGYTNIKKEFESIQINEDAKNL